MLSSGLTGDPEGLRPGRELRHGLPLSVNFAWTTVGHLVYAACQWGQLSILAKLGSPKMLGEFVLAFAVASPVMMLSSLELRSIQVTDADREYSFGHYLGLCLATATLGLLSIVGFTAVMGYVRETALVIVAIGLAKAIGSVSEAYHSLLQLHERMDRVAKSLMINSPLSLAALATDMFLTGSVLWGALGMAAAAAAVLLAYDVRSGRAVLRAVHQMGSADNDGAKTAELTRPRWEVRTLASLAWLALPLGLVRMLMSLNTTIPRYAIERYVGRSQLGVLRPWLISRWQEIWWWLPWGGRPRHSWRETMLSEKPRRFSGFLPSSLLQGCCSVSLVSRRQSSLGVQSCPFFTSPNTPASWTSLSG